MKIILDKKYQLFWPPERQLCLQFGLKMTHITVSQRFGDAVFGFSIDKKLPNRYSCGFIGQISIPGCDLITKIPFWAYNLTLGDLNKDEEIPQAPNFEKNSKI